MRQEWWRTGRFAAFREIFEEFNKCCTKSISLDNYIAIDETYPTRSGISFKTCSKDKPAQYSLNFTSLGSSRRPYTYYTVPYIRKTVEGTESHIKDMLTLVNCWMLWATWLFIESYKHLNGSLLHIYFPGWMAIWQKYYLHRDVKFKSKRVAKRNQRNKKAEKKTVGQGCQLSF